MSNKQNKTGDWHLNFEELSLDEMQDYIDAELLLGSLQEKTHGALSRWRQILQDAPSKELERPGFVKAIMATVAMELTRYHEHKYGR